MSTASTTCNAAVAAFTDAEIQHVRQAMIIAFMKRKRTKETSSAKPRTREVHRRETHEALAKWVEPGRISQPAFLYLEKNAPRLLLDYNIRCPVTGRKCRISMRHIGNSLDVQASYHEKYSFPVSCLRRLIHRESWRTTSSHSCTAESCSACLKYRKRGRPAASGPAECPVVRSSRYIYVNISKQQAS